jgi:hypothetical protein
LKEHGLFAEKAVAGRLQAVAISATALQALQPLCNRVRKVPTKAPQAPQEASSSKI